MQFMLFSNQEDYLSFRTMNAEHFVWRIEEEQNLAQELLPYEGYCALCNKQVMFRATREHPCVIDGVTYPNYREHLVCSECGYNSRMRGSLHFIGRLLPAHTPSPHIYMMEQKTPLYQLISKKYENVWGSEFLGDRVPFGDYEDGIRNENAPALTFSDERFDAVLSFDVLEHISDYEKALCECFRVLKLSGHLIFTVPFINSARKTCVRAKIKADGTVEHMLPPEYHGDPLSEEGCLCFYHFGWDILESLKRAGFSDARVVSFWSKEYGYLGLGEQIIFYAKK